MINQHGWLWAYPLVNVYITMGRSTIFYGKKLTISMAIFNSFLYVYQRVIPSRRILAPMEPHFFYEIPRFPLGGFTKSWDGMGLLWDGHFSVAWWIRTIDFWVGVLRWSPKDDFSWVEKPGFFSTKHQALFKKRFHGHPIRISHTNIPVIPVEFPIKQIPFLIGPFPWNSSVISAGLAAAKAVDLRQLEFHLLRRAPGLCMGLLGKSQTSEVGFFMIFCMMIRGFFGSKWWI